MLLAIFLVSLLAISAVSAEDNSTNDIAVSNDEIVLDEDIDNVNLLKEENEQSVSSNPFTDKHFFDLYGDLEGSDINLTTDYQIKSIICLKQ